MYRRAGTLLPLERRILEISVRRADTGVYGFSLAQELAGERGQTNLAAHGTLYKALDRLRRAGLMTAEWEDADSADAQHRPRRRMYRVTAEGVRAIQTAATPSRAVRVEGARP
jgi:DNA-binding PadR family transcriptional regulator